MRNLELDRKSGKTQLPTLIFKKVDSDYNSISRRDDGSTWIPLSIGIPFFACSIETVSNTFVWFSRTYFSRWYWPIWDPFSTYRTPVWRQALGEWVHLHLSRSLLISRCSIRCLELGQLRCTLPWPWCFCCGVSIVKKEKVIPVSPLFICYAYGFFVSRVVTMCYFGMLYFVCKLMVRRRAP